MLRVATVRALSAARVRAPLPVASHAAIPARGLLNIRERLEGFVDNKKEQKQLEMFRKQMEQMKTLKSMTLKSYAQTVEEGLQQGSGWRGMLPGVKKSPELAQLKEHKAVLDAMLPHEIDGDGSNIKRREKLRISEASGVSVEEINRILTQFTLMTHIHRWVQHRVESSKPVPDSPEELQQMMSTDRSSISLEFAKLVAPGRVPRGKRMVR